MSDDESITPPVSTWYDGDDQQTDLLSTVDENGPVDRNESELDSVSDMTAGKRKHKLRLDKKVVSSMLSQEENDKDTSEESRPQAAASHLLTQVKSEVLEYIDLTNQITESKAAIKLLTERKGELEENISAFLIAQNQPGVKIGQRRITLINTKQTKPLNKDFLKQAILEKTDNEKLAEELTKIAFEGRPSAMIQKLRLESQKAAR